MNCKVEKILNGSLDLIPSPSTSVKIQIMSRKVCLSCKGKPLLGDVNNFLPLHLKQTFPPVIWIFTEGEGDGIENRLPFKIFSTLIMHFGVLKLQTDIIQSNFCLENIHLNVEHLLITWLFLWSTILWFTKLGRFLSKSERV